MKKYRWGFIGSGGISHRAVKDISTLPQAEVYAVASRSQEAANIFARKYSLAQAYDSYKKLCADPQVDVVYIGTPHVSHRELTEHALRHGKAVLCEKPLSVSEQDVQAMVSAAQKHKTFLMEALWSRFLPVISEVKQWISAGEIGEIQSISGRFCSKAKYDPQSRIFAKELGGGALLDLGVYPISVACFLVGQAVQKISATGKIGETQVDESASVQLIFDSGTRADLHCSLIESSGESMMIYGSTGAIEIPYFWRATEAYMIKNNNRVRETHGEESFKFEAIEVMRCLEAGLTESPVMAWKDSLSVARIIDESLNQIVAWQ